MKKRLAIFLSLIMVFSLTALTSCGGGSNEQPDDAAPAAEEPAADAAADTSGDAAADTSGDTASGAASNLTAEEAESLRDAAEYGYTGTDLIEAAVYEYVGDELSDRYPDSRYSIPVVQIVAKDDSNPADVLVWGDFWVFNYDPEGDILKCTSGGNHPGLLHLEKDEDGYEVERMDAVEDGGNFESSAKNIFGDKYDAFMKIYGDEKLREKLRGETLANFVKAGNLNFTKYQDEGWDPVDIPL